MMNGVCFRLSRLISHATFICGIQHIRTHFVLLSVEYMAALISVIEILEKFRIMTGFVMNEDFNYSA